MVRNSLRRCLRKKQDLFASDPSPRGGMWGERSVASDKEKGDASSDEAGETVFIA